MSSLISTWPLLSSAANILSIFFSSSGMPAKVYSVLVLVNSGGTLSVTVKEYCRYWWPQYMMVSLCSPGIAVPDSSMLTPSRRSSVFSFTKARSSADISVRSTYSLRSAGSGSPSSIVKLEYEYFGLTGRYGLHEVRSRHRAAVIIISNSIVMRLCLFKLILLTLLRE